MTKGCAPCWQVAVALCGALSVLLAWDSLQAQQPDPAPEQAAGSGIATPYRAPDRSEIMIRAAGLILN